MAGIANATTILLLRWALRLAGIALLVLAGIGVIVPGLPSTPFVLLAASCFARSSPRLYDWLIRTRLFGPMIRDWREQRAISRGAKRSACATIAMVGGASVFLSNFPPVFLSGLAIVLLGVIAWIGTRPSPSPVASR